MWDRVLRVCKSGECVKVCESVRVCEGVLGCLSMCERVCESVGVCVRVCESVRECVRERDWKMCPISRDNALDDDWCSPLYRQSNGPSCSNYLTHSLSHLSYTLTQLLSHTLTHSHGRTYLSLSCLKVVRK